MKILLARRKCFTQIAFRTMLNLHARGGFAISTSRGLAANWCPFACDLGLRLLPCSFSSSPGVAALLQCIPACGARIVIVVPMEHADVCDLRRVGDSTRLNPHTQQQHQCNTEYAHHPWPAFNHTCGQTQPFLVCTTTLRRATCLNSSTRGVPIEWQHTAKHSV